MVLDGCNDGELLPAAAVASLPLRRVRMLLAGGAGTQVGPRDWRSPLVNRDFKMAASLQLLKSGDWDVYYEQGRRSG